MFRRRDNLKNRSENIPAVPEKKRRKLSYERKKSLYGCAFLAIWIIGTIYMFIIPIIQSIGFALSDTEYVDTAEKAAALGMDRPGIYTEWNGFENISWAFTVNPDYPRNLASSLGETAYKVPLILVFSLFAALMLNDKFRGRTLARAIFFLPVLISTGPVLRVINGDILSQGVTEAAQFSSLFRTDFVGDFLMFLGLNNIIPVLTETVSGITSSLLNLIWDSWIQILIFLSALQNIPASAKEAAAIEGASGWEFFWKLTIPTISPMLFANLIYTSIDAFVKSDNPVMRQVMTYIRQWEYDHASAMAWIYFLIVGLVLAAVTAITSRFVFYQND